MLKSHHIQIWLQKTHSWLSGEKRKTNKWRKLKESGKDGDGERRKRSIQALDQVYAVFHAGAPRVNQLLRQGGLSVVNQSSAQ